MQTNVKKIRGIIILYKLLILTFAVAKEIYDNRYIIQITGQQSFDILLLVSVYLSQKQK